MRLIAHEVGHVLQQRHHAGPSAPQCKPKDASQVPDVHRLARRIHEAFEETGFLGFGATNEAVVFEVLRTARDHGLTTELKAVYGAEYPNEFGLEARLADELSGDELDLALELLRAGLAASEHRTRPRVSVVGHGASASAVQAAQDSQVFDQLAERNQVQIQNDTIEIHVIPKDKKLTDLPEFAHLKGVKTFDGRNYDDLRGVGGTRVGNVVRFAIAEEQLVPVAGAPPGYGPGFVGAHESGHVVMDFALTSSQQTRLKAAYDARKKANGPWLPPPDYTKSSSSEYWAQVSAAYFGRPYSDTEEHRKVFNRDWLKRNDPAIFLLLQEVYR
jgi:hypothetical protein